MQIDGQAVILAKDLVESVMQRIGVSDYTILGTVKGAELELLRFTHPFMTSMFRQFSATTLRWMPVPVPFIPRQATVRTTM